MNRVKNNSDGLPNGKGDAEHLAQLRNQLEYAIKQANDMSLAAMLYRHIENPCIEPRTGNDIRQFYLNEAEKVIANMENPRAVKLLEYAIKKYKTN